MYQTEDESSPLDELPQRVIDRLPEEIVEQLRAGTIDRIPDDVVEQLPPRFQDQIPERLIASAGENAGLTAVLVIAIVVGVSGFLWGLMKSLIKLALFFAAVAVGAFLWYTQR